MSALCPRDKEKKRENAPEKTTLDWKLGPAQGMGAAGGGAGIRLGLARNRDCFPFPAMGPDYLMGVLKAIGQK